MNGKYKIGLIVSLLFMTLFISIQQVQNGSSSEQISDPYRLIDTDLEYAIPNGSYFMWNTSQSVIGSGIIGNGTVNGTEIHDHELIDSEWDYRSERFTSQKINDSNTKIVIKRYSNITDNPECPPDIDEWEYDDNATVLINNTLVGVMNGQSYYPDDVFVDDIFTNDASFYKSLINELNINPLFANIWESINEIIESGNSIVYDMSNSSTAIITNRYEGRYLYESSTDIRINASDVLTDTSINVTTTLLVGVKMNCFHVAEQTLINMTYRIQLVNNSNPLEFTDIELSLLMDNILICSTLVPCAWGYQFFGEGTQSFAMNWWWILLALIIIIGIATIIMVMQRRKICDETVNMVSKGINRPLSESEFDGLPDGCKIDKYRPKL